MLGEYQNPGPSREEIDAIQGPLLLEFGTAWCGYCQAAAPAIAQALQEFPNVRHIKVEDGPGRRLGRSFRVKLSGPLRSYSKTARKPLAAAIWDRGPKEGLSQGHQCRVEYCDECVALHL